MPYTYNANDCSAADLDGDGEYEIVLKWDPTNSKDNSQSGFTGNVFLDAYKLNGTLLWRIDLGQNIRAGAHYTQFMVYDLDGDGRAELACKTAPGSRDGLGNYVDGNAAFAVYTNSAGYILSGPEYFTIFDGLTGANLWTTNYIVPRGNVSDWGDGYGNRVDRFLACVAYLDGVRPSVVMCRGYYTRATLCAWDWRNGVLTQRWLFDTGFSGGPNAGYKGQGAHSLTVGDVDGDGKDEITFGACAIDDNGTGLYNTTLGHGDALHQSDMNPDRPGLEVWMVHESPSSYGPNGLEFRDAKNGGLIFGVDGQGADIGRGVAIDIDPNYRGYEMWGARGGLMSATGVQISSSRPGQMNFASWWDADTIREILDGTTITKWFSAASSGSSIFSPSGVSSINGTKSTPNLSVDLFGDWREEMIFRTSDNLNLRIYTTTTLATNRIVTLMHDPQYRLAIAWQNVAYNQPPHPGFYIGPGMFAPPVPPISTADLVWRGGGANIWDADGTANWFTNGVWVGANPAATFLADRSVLFDLSGSNHTAISLSGALAPSSVTVHSPKDYTFGGTGSLNGSMKLVKAGPARLTLNNTNTYTGGTFVSGGALFVNGTLNSSAVTVERRGSVEGPSQFGGTGRLGNGLTVQAGATLTVGAGTNSPGTLTVTNGVTLLGALNQFDLSNDPTGGSRTNDIVRVYGSLTLSGTNTIEIRQLDGFLNGGLYPLITYTGTLSGGLGNLALSGSFIQPVALTNPPGMIALLAVIPAAPPTAPSALTATAVGAYQINLSWTDNSSEENAFFIERSTGNPTNFTQIAVNPPNDATYSDTSVAPSTTYYYRIRGTNLAGASAYSNTNSATTTPPPTSLAWRGDGSVNAWDIGGSVNWYDGAKLVVFNDGAIVTFDQAGSNNIPLAVFGTMQPGSVSVTATKNYVIGGSGVLGGKMILTKSGSGTLSLNTTNTFSGGVNLNAGVLSLGNGAGAGAGAVRFNGGSLTMAGSGQPTYANALVINSNATITSSGGNNNIVSGAWSGNAAATLTVTISSSGTFTLGGDMTGFPGTVALGSSGGFFRFNGSSGSANTSFDLGTGIATLNNRNGVTVTLGALSGVATTSLNGAGSADAPSTYIVGGKNLSTTFNGTIKNASVLRIVNIQKVGTGTWTLTSTNNYTGTTIVNAGKLVVNGNQSAATGDVTVNSAGTLSGSGIIGGNTIISGTLTPGTSIGTLTFGQNLTFSTNGTAQFEISKSPLGNDTAVVAGNAAYGGTLDVLNTSVELLEAGDNFQLFSAGSYSGSFGQYELPVLESGLAWNVSQLAVDGRLWVVSTNPPVINAVSATGGNFSMSGVGGTPSWNYSVLTSTNLTLPLSQWGVAASGQFDASGNFFFSTPVDPADAQRFYVLQSQ